jgi:hypothetical protein
MARFGNLRSPGTRALKAMVLAGAMLWPMLSGAGASELHALVIGIDEYRFGSSLRGAVNDAEDIAATLRRLGVSDLTVLLNGNATRDRIEASWRAILRRAQPGDKVLLTYAGHGSQEKEHVPGSEVDNKDEVLLLGGFNEVGPGTRERILDDEFNQWFRAAGERGLEVIFVADACYSGTLTRSFDERAGEVLTRAAPLYSITTDMLVLDLPSTNIDLGDDELPHVTFLAAGQESEQIPEIQIRDANGNYQARGALSYIFARALEGRADENGDGILTRGELKLYVRENVRMYSEARQTPNLLPRSFDGFEVLTAATFPTLASSVVSASTSASAAPVTGTEFAPTRLAVDGLSASGGAGVAGSLSNAVVVASGDTPDLIWDSGTGEIITHLGDVIAHDVRQAGLQGVVDKWRALEAIRLLSEGSHLVMRILPDDSAHRLGETVGIEISGLRVPHFTLFSLSGDGTLHYHYPYRSDPADLPLNRPYKVEFEVTPPFGADHLIAITSERVLTGLNKALSRVDGQQAARTAVALLITHLQSVDYQMGIQGLYTAP